jgi:ribosomal-protein-alanine N-acetyltransferase
MTDLSIVFDPFPVLHTPRLLLRQITPADAPAIFALRSDPRVVRYMGVSPYTSLAEAEAWVLTVADRHERRQQLRWAMTLHEQPETMIGDISLNNIDTYHLHAEIGYAMGADHWGQGLASEAVQAVLDFGFTRMGMYRIEACLDIANMRSKTILERNGFTYDGVLRGRFLEADGSMGDEHYYGILLPEWRARQPG